LTTRKTVNARTWTASVWSLAVGDEGQDLVEYALLSGIVGIAGVLVYPAILDGLQTLFNGTQAATQGIWQPCAPAPAACP